MGKKKGLSSEGAKEVRAQGHEDALQFALLIGKKSDYHNDLKAKKDVVDPSGDTHSLKSGKKKWQIFLYGLGRFQTDDAWQVMDGIGQLLIDCIEAFPPSFDDYQLDKKSSKQKLRVPMVELASKLQNPARLRALLYKSLFNGGEVDYLTIRHNDIYHVFLNKDVVNAMDCNLTVCNSQAKQKGQTDEQKVLFKYNERTLGEIEMRNDSKVHYREIRFNMMKPRVMELLFEHIPMVREYNEFIYVYGNADKRFGHWKA